MKNEIHEAYRFLRENNHTISDQALDFIKEAALKELGKRKTTRHPSEITPDEFFELAKIVDSTVKNVSGFEFKLKKDSIRMYSEKRLFEIKYDPAFNFTAFNSYLMEFIHYDFSQSLKIAAYLDSIGIEYRPKK